MLVRTDTMTYVTDETNVNQHELLNVNLHFIAYMAEWVTV
jgi:hypothetical protein